MITYEDKEKSYIICPQGLKVGDTIESGKSAEIKIGNSLQLKDIPPGTSIHNVELIPGNGGNLARSKTERVGRMLLMHANSREDIKEANAGDIVALAGLKYTNCSISKNSCCFLK